MGRRGQGGGGEGRELHGGNLAYPGGPRRPPATGHLINILEKGYTDINGHWRNSLERGTWVGLIESW